MKFDSKVHKPINLPLRRYAIFENIFGQQYTIVCRGEDIRTAPKWGGFVSWLGGVKPPTVRCKGGCTS
jgi:hypothetical protein